MSDPDVHRIAVLILYQQRQPTSASSSKYVSKYDYIIVWPKTGLGWLNQPHWPTLPLLSTNTQTL